MEAYEVAYLEAVVDELSASVAAAMREDGTEYAAGPDRLTSAGTCWLRGFLVGRLTMLRASAVGNPNLSAADVERVSALADERGGAVAAELYA